MVIQCMFYNATMILPAALLLIVSCELYHPGLISRKESEKLITQACIANLSVRFPDLSLAGSSASGETDYEKKAAGSAAYLCNYDNHIYTVKDEMVRRSDTEKCARIVAAMPGPEYPDLIIQYAIIRNFLCDIKAVRFLEFTEPGQGGI